MKLVSVKELVNGFRCAYVCEFCGSPEVTKRMNPPQKDTMTKWACRTCGCKSAVDTLGPHPVKFIPVEVAEDKKPQGDKFPNCECTGCLGKRVAEVRAKQRDGEFRLQLNNRTEKFNMPTADDLERLSKHLANGLRTNAQQAEQITELKRQLGVKDNIARIQLQNMNRLRERLSQRDKQYSELQDQFAAEHTKCRQLRDREAELTQLRTDLTTANQIYTKIAKENLDLTAALAVERIAKTAHVRAVHTPEAASAYDTVRVPKAIDQFYTPQKFYAIMNVLEKAPRQGILEPASAYVARWWDMIVKAAEVKEGA